MRHYLSQHPHIYMCPQEDEGYFAKEQLFQLGIPSSDNYENKFKALSLKSLRGELCTDYMYKPACISRIQLYNPETKFIAVLRNPAERAFSHWQMNVNEGKEELPFMDAVEREQNELGNSDNHSLSSSYVDRGMYCKQIQNLLQYFNPHQLLFIRNEDLRDDTEVVMYQVLQFLGLPYLEVDKTPKNLGDYPKSMDPKDYNNLIEIFKQDVTDLEHLLDWNCTDWLRPITSGRPMMAYIAS